MNDSFVNGLLRRLDPALRYTTHEIQEDIIRIYVVSVRDEVACPCCGTPSDKRHSTYRRAFQDLPVMGLKTEIVIENRIMFCTNPSCSKKTFAEGFNGLDPYARKTKRLWDKIIDVSLDTSSVSAAATLGDGIADITRRTICGLLSREPAVSDKTGCTVLGIDDWAIRKGERYGTVFVDMETHRILDIIDSRETSDVVRALNQYPSVEAVCRDGSFSYKAAVAEALPGAAQISDYFHLLKGLLEACQDYLKKELGSIITLSAAAESDTVWNTSRPLTKAEREVSENTERRMERRNKLHSDVLALKAQGKGRYRIAQELGIGEKTAQRYMDPNYTPVDGMTGRRKRRSKVAPYADLVFDLYEKGLKLTEILGIIQERGYTGKYNALHAYVAREKRNRTRAGASGMTIDRRKAISMLYNPDGSYVSSDGMMRLRCECETYRRIEELVTDFRTMFDTADTGGLDTWLERAEAFGAKIKSFAGGVRRDIDAVKAAIQLRLTSGAVEGSVTKIKLAKRIMYGRCGFNLLRGKILRRETRNARRACA